MNKTQKKIQKLSTEIADNLTSKQRDNGNSFYCIKDNAPSWVNDVMYNCHADMLPDDYKYQFINEAACALSDADDFDDIQLEADIYTSDLTSWLNSNNSRVYYLTEALEEGFEITDGFQLLAYAQQKEKQEVLYSLISELEKLATQKKVA